MARRNGAYIFMAGRDGVLCQHCFLLRVTVRSSNILPIVLPKFSMSRMDRNGLGAWRAKWRSLPALGAELLAVLPLPRCGALLPAAAFFAGLLRSLPSGLLLTKTITSSANAPLSSGRRAVEGSAALLFLSLLSPRLPAYLAARACLLSTRGCLLRAGG